MHPGLIKNFKRGFEVGDVALFFYIAAFVRQYFWVVSNNKLAWIVTLITSALLFVLHLETKPVDESRAPRSFHFVVILPLLFFYLLRVALPDMSWDVLDYRLINAERSLNGWPMIDGDFFPVRFPFNPAPDMVMGISRYVFGYRLGTAMNLAVLIWSATILEKLLRLFVESPALRCLFVVALILTEQLLFEVNNYMVDLLALPLMLEATRLVLSTDKDRTDLKAQLIRIAIYIGMSLAFKLTNLAFAVPIILLCIYRMRSGDVWRDARLLALGIVALLAPLFPYSLFIYAQTGNPVFPLYNWIFKSPYWPVIDLRTERWGPIVDDIRFKSMKLWEVLLWPLLLPFRVEHTAGDLGPHWGRVSLAFASSIVVLLWRGANRRAREIAAVAVFGSVLWSAASGMLRYAAYLELVGGMLAIYLAFSLFRGSGNGTTASLFRRSLALIIFLAVSVQSVSSCVYAYKFEWGSRPAFFQDSALHLREAPYILRDRSYERFLSSAERSMFERDAVWIESGPLTSGVQAMLDNDAPQWCLYMSEYFATEAGRSRLKQAFEKVNPKKMYSLALPHDLELASRYIRDAGFEVGVVRGLSLPFYSNTQRFHSTFLIEVLRPGSKPALDTTRVSSLSAALPEEGFRADLRWSKQPPARVRPREKFSVEVVASNSSNVVWPALGLSDNTFRIFLGDHWLNAQGAIVINDDSRNSLPYDVEPHSEVAIPLEVTAPPQAGEYLLEVDLLQERVAWFGTKGSRTLRVAVVVE